MSAAIEQLSGCFPSTSEIARLQVFDQLAVERPDEQAERIAPSFLLGIGGEHRNSAAQAVVLQYQFEPLPGVEPVLKRNLDRRAQSFLSLRRVRVWDVERVERPDDRARIADCTEIGPCMRDVSICQNQLADLACRLYVSILIGLLQVFRHVTDASAGNEGQA